MIGHNLISDLIPEATGGEEFVREDKIEEQVAKDLKNVTENDENAGLEKIAGEEGWSDQDDYT